MTRSSASISNDLWTRWNGSSSATRFRTSGSTAAPAGLRGMPRAKADGITRASTGTMLRKQILPSPLIPSSRRGKDVACVATVFVTSEDPDHPIDYAFDGRRGPDGSRWIAGNVGEQTLILAFDAPQTIYKVVVDIDEPDVARTQEIDLSISDDGGQTYREILRQEYNFSPPNTTREHEEWSINADPISHLRLRIKPDKGANIGRATLTTLAIE